jgi:hypothetical protein
MNPVQDPGDVILDCDLTAAKFYTQEQRMSLVFLKLSSMEPDEVKQIILDQIEGKQIRFSKGGSNKKREFCNTQLPAAMAEITMALTRRYLPEIATESDYESTVRF